MAYKRRKARRRSVKCTLHAGCDSHDHRSEIRVDTTGRISGIRRRPPPGRCRPSFAPVGTRRNGPVGRNAVRSNAPPHTTEVVGRNAGWVDAPRRPSLFGGENLSLVPHHRLDLFRREGLAPRRHRGAFHPVCDNPDVVGRIRKVTGDLAPVELLAQAPIAIHTVARRTSSSMHVLTLGQDGISGFRARVPSTAGRDRCRKHEGSHEDEVASHDAQRSETPAQRSTRTRESGASLQFRHTDPVGFNPMRKHKNSPADYAMVAAAFVVVLLLVGWGLFGGKL